MSDPNVERWRQKGEVFLWRYRDKPRNFPGWHLTASAEGAASLLELLRLMRDARYASKQIVTISDPTPRILRVPNYIRGVGQWRSAERWQLSYAKGRAEPGEWKLVFTGKELQLSVGETYLLKLIKGVEDVSRGIGDYSISGDDAGFHECIWFW